MRATLPIVIASLVGLASPVLASPEEEARVLLIAWSEAYAARDHDGMAKLHAPSARVYGVDALQYVGREAISEFYYFEAQRATNQSVVFGAHSCQVYDDGNGLCSGSYDLTQTLASGETRVRPAQFSIALVVEDNQWLIYDHRTTWTPAVVADCGTAIPADKVGLVGGITARANLCSDPVKSGSIDTLPQVTPVGATMVEPAQ